MEQGEEKKKRMRGLGVGKGLVAQGSELHWAPLLSVFLNIFSKESWRFRTMVFIKKVKL